MLTKMNTYQTKTPEPLEPQHSSEKQFLAVHNLGLYQYIKKKTKYSQFTIIMLCVNFV